MVSEVYWVGMPTLEGGVADKNATKTKSVRFEALSECVIYVL